MDFSVFGAKIQKYSDLFFQNFKIITFNLHNLGIFATNWIDGQKMGFYPVCVFSFNLDKKMHLYFFRCRKSVKSLFFLLPLLGITNVLHFVWPNPLRGSWLSFAIWSITSHFLYSFQGVFVASVYFLFDDKVRMRKIIISQKCTCDWFPIFCFYWPFKPGFFVRATHITMFENYRNGLIFYF